MRGWRAPIPHEHGAWGALLACLLVALSHAWTRQAPSLVVGALFLLAFAIQEPLRGLALRRPGPWWPWVLVYGALLAAGASFLVAACDAWLVLPAAALGVLLTALDLVAHRRHLHRSAVLRTLGLALLTALLPAMLLVGRRDGVAHALTLWWLVFAYCATRIPVVRGRVAARRGERPGVAAIAAAQVALYLSVGLLVGGGLVDAKALLAVLPGTVVAFLPPGRGSVRALGWGEVALLLWFAVLLSV